MSGIKGYLGAALAALLAIAISFGSFVGTPKPQTPTAILIPSKLSVGQALQHISQNEPHLSVLDVRFDERLLLIMYTNPNLPKQLFREFGYVSFSLNSTTLCLT